MIDKNKEIWGYDIRGQIYGSDPPKEYYATYKISIDNSGQTIISDYFEGELSFNIQTGGSAFVFIPNFNNDYSAYSKDILYSNERLYIVRSREGSKYGYFYVRTNPEGGIAIEEDTLFNNAIHYGIKRYGDCLYYIENKTIKKMKIQQDNQSFDIYSNSSIIESAGFTIVNDYLIFNKYITATNVGTYKLKIGESEPELISEHDAEIRDVIELKF